MKTALVAGASGLAGRAIIERLRRDGGIKILALARRANELFADLDGVEPLACDLLNEASVLEALKPHQINYLFYAAVFTGKGGVANFAPKSDAMLRMAQAALRHATAPVRVAASVMPGIVYGALDRAAGAGEASINRTMIKNVLDACRGDALEHVTVVTGGKYYGHHLGPRFYPGYQAPFEERHPRAPGRNWYYAVEDYVADSQARDSTWHYSTLRPSSIMGFATGSPYNLGTSLAVYATIRKYLGQPLLLPADPRVQSVDIEFSPANLIADMALWTVHEPKCRNEAYNASFGARTTWKEVWPHIADYFGMPFEIANRALCVGKLTSDYARTWKAVSEQFGTAYSDFNQICCPAFMDQQFLMDWDAGYSPEKSRAHGYGQSVDPRTMFHQLFDELVEQIVIPNPKYVKQGQ